MNKFGVLFISFLSIVSISCSMIPNAYSDSADIKVCFTPGERCDKEIINEINHENNRVFVEAYYLTSASIINSIIKSSERGAEVKVILDKSQERGKNMRYMDLLTSHSVPVWIDNTVSIAHNKIIILGDHEVITGSYNFTKSAQEKNAENVIIIHSADVQKKFLDNFQRRLSHSYLRNHQKP